MSNIINKINLSKINLTKVAERIGIGNQLAKIILCLDISGSMEEMLYDGRVQRLLERVLPIAMKFDNDGILDLYFFNSKAKYHGQVSLKNIENFVKREVIKKYELTGTKYSKAINLISNDLLSTKTTLRGKETIVEAGFLSKLFGAKDEISYEEFDKQKSISEQIKYVKFSKNELPTYVLFVTDGDNHLEDRKKAIEALTISSKLPIFWKFVGIGNSDFDFLQKLDDLKNRFVDNADFYNSENMLANTNDVNEDELYDNLLREFPEWLKLCYSKILTPNI